MRIGPVQRSLSQNHGLTLNGIDSQLCERRRPKGDRSTQPAPREHSWPRLLPLKGKTMLIHPIVERLRGLGLTAMAEAFIDMRNQSAWCMDIPLDLSSIYGVATVGAAPMNMRDGIGKAVTVLTLGQRGVRPALDGLSDMLNAHGEMKPYVDGLCGDDGLSARVCPLPWRKSSQ